MILQTARLVLRPITLGDADTLCALAAHPGVGPMLLPGRAAGSAVRHHVELSAAHWAPPSGLSFGFVIARQERPEQIIGQCGLSRLGRRLGTVGWDIHPDHAGRGFATEAAATLMALGFGACRLRRIQAECYADNAPSRRVMEKVGMRRAQAPWVRLALWWSYPDLRPKVRYVIHRGEWVRHRGASLEEADLETVAA